MDTGWSGWLDRWTEAGLIDAVTAQRIRLYEAERGAGGALRWPILIALAFGGLMMCGGILLFVAANWDVLSPAQRFALVLALTASFHLAGALTAERFPAMSEALHAIGTVVLGAGIALAGQIFNLEEHWPGGIMMWALGAGAGWFLLRHTAQLALFALLAPAWLLGEWFVANDRTGVHSSDEFVAAAGVFLLAVSYFTAPEPGRVSPARRALLWLGAIGIVVGGIMLAAVTSARRLDLEKMPAWLQAVGWIGALAGPVTLAAILRRRDAWPNAVAALWVAALCFIAPLSRGVAVYGWWAAGSVGLVAWGVRDRRIERINIGAVFFAATVLTFYFSQVMDKLGRSASLVGLGLLFLGGGWSLERIRRQLVERTREGR